MSFVKGRNACPSFRAKASHATTQTRARRARHARPGTVNMLQSARCAFGPTVNALPLLALMRIPSASVPAAPLTLAAAFGLALVRSQARTVAQRLATHSSSTRR